MSATPAITLKRIWSLSLPIIAANVMLPLVGAVDTAMMGHQPDSLLLGAVAVGASVFMFVLWSFGFLRMSTGGLSARAWGEASGEALRGHFARATCVALVLGGLLLLFHPWVIDAALSWMPMERGQAPYARTYLQIRFLAVPVVLLHYVLLGMLIGMQSTRGILLVQLLLNGINLVLDVVTVHGFGMGIAGIAWASVIAEVSALCFAIWLVVKRLELHPGPWPTWLTLRRLQPFLALLKVNADILIRTQLLLFCFFYLTVLGTRQGATILAANALLLKLMEFVVFALDGFANASEALTGEAIGQGKVGQVRETVRLGRWLSLSVALAASPVLGLGGSFFLSLLTRHQHVIDVAMVYLPWVCLAPLISVMSYQYDGVFIGGVCSQEMRNSMIIATCVYLASTWLLLPLWGNHGLWVSLLLLNGTRGLTLHLWLPRVYAKAEEKGRG